MKFKLTVAQFNQVLRNVNAKRRGVTIDKADLMSAVARGCYVGKMPQNEMAIVINLLVREGYIEVLNNRVYVTFDYVGYDKVIDGFYVHHNNDYYRQTANIRAWDTKQKEKAKEVK